MLITILACAAIAVLALVVIGVALLPMCLLSGAFAWLRASRLDREIGAAERLLAEH